MTERALPESKSSSFSEPRSGLSALFWRLAGLTILALRRLRHQPGLTLLALVGIVLAVGLVTSAGFFSQAVDTVIMRQELARYQELTGRPAFSLRVFAPSSDLVPLDLERVEALGRQMATTVSDRIGLPVERVEIQANSDIFRLGREAGGDGTRVNVVSLSGALPHMEILAGDPLNDDGTSQERIDVWLHRELADETAVEIGESLFLSPSGSEVALPLRIAGIWEPIDEKDAYWFGDPNASLANALLVRRGDYLETVQPLSAAGVRAANWRIVLDENRATPSQGRRYVEGFEQIGPLIQRFLPDARVTTPSLPLSNFVARQTTLTTLLLGFNVPGLAFLLYFLALTAAVIAYWQRREIAILVSRGMGRLSVLNFTLLETVLLFLIGLPLGLGFGILLARLMGYAASFLIFRERPPLPVSLAGVSWPLVALTLGLVLGARLFASFLAGRQSIVDQQREHARPNRGPFWYRNFLDVLLLIPTFYAYDQLQQRGSLALLVEDSAQDLYRDPLLVLVPALFIVSLALVAMRPFPLVMSLLDKLANRSPWLPIHLSLRQLGRQSHTYINPLLLVIVALALGVYTFSMAQSLDGWLVDRISYRAGADVAFEPFLESAALSAEMGGEWIPTQAEYRAVEGVADAVRVGDYQAEIQLASGRRTARFLAVDRSDFPRVSWFRGDLAREPLGGLMNRLASSSEAVLVSQSFLDENLLQVGDPLPTLVLADFGASLRTDFRIAGVYENFPTVYEDETVLVGNLEYIFSFFGLRMPHDIWLRLEPGQRADEVLDRIEAATGVGAIRVEDVARSLDFEQAQMERVGVFGTLTVSFLMSALMAALGLLTYSYASLHERLFSFSVLRAIGMRRQQLAAQVLLEYGLLTAYGAGMGVLIGSLAAELFVPLFQVTGVGQAAMPPLIPIIAGAEIAPLVLLFAGLMILLELVVLSSALYQRIFVALRMGDQG